jgi:hypothetical protein
LTTLWLQVEVVAVQTLLEAVVLAGIVLVQV